MDSWKQCKKRKKRLIGVKILDDRCSMIKRNVTQSNIMVRLLITSEWKSIVRLMTAPVDEFCTRPASFLSVTETLPPFRVHGYAQRGTLMSPISSDYEKQSRYLHGIYFRKYFEKTIGRELN